MVLRANILTSEQISVYIQTVLEVSPKESSAENPQKLITKIERESQVKGRMLSNVIAEYIRERVALKKWSEKTLSEANAVFELFVRVVGDIQIKNIDRKIMVNYMENIQNLPSNMNKIPKFRGKNVNEILAMPNDNPISIRTVNKYIERISSMMNWCVRQEYITRNPAMGLSISSKISDDQQRAAYSLEDITRIKNSLMRESKGKPERYWIPLIALYTGMRLNEISQLYSNDVVSNDGIWCFDINDEKNKRVKNPSSKRQVPVHLKLIELGFMDYVEDVCKQGHSRLWMNLKEWRDGYSKDIGRWYGRFNRTHVTKDPLKVFHSFRHLICDTLKQAGVEVSIISEIVGHSGGSVTLSRYGKRYRPRILLEALLKLPY